MDKIVANEAQLFKYMKERIPDLKKSGIPHSRYDFYSLAKNAVFEVKVRRIHYDELVIEKDKYDALMAKAEETGTTPYYVNATPDGVFAFNLNEVTNISWSERKMPKTSHFKNRSKVTKQLGYLDVCSAIRI